MDGLLCVVGRLVGLVCDCRCGWWWWWCVLLVGWVGFVGECVVVVVCQCFGRLGWFCLGLSVGRLVGFVCDCVVRLAVVSRV